MAVYDPSTPPERQVQSWACSIRAATWILRSLGVNVTAAQLQEEMVPGYVTPELGLLDGRGAGLADIVRHPLPPETPVEVLWAPSWDDVVARAGRGPIGIGSGSLYHWLNVAATIDAATLSAPNPAPNYPPDSPLHDTLTRAQFDQYAPWALVFVQAAPAPPVVVPPAAPSYSVGSGILDAMTANGDGPASDEMFFGEPGRGWSEAYSLIGRRYTWVASLGRCFVNEGWTAR